MELPSFADATRGHLFGIARLAVTSPLPPAPFPSARPRVNVYLCIKQALFIRPMNMHCLVAVARCRVQTRRYHCLINHIQSQRLTLWPHFPLFAVLYPRSPFSALITPLAEEHPPCHPSELSAHILPHRVIPLALSSPQSTRPMFPSRQPAAIDINLRNFFGAPTCHRVTALPSRPGVPDARGRNTR